MSAVVVPLAPSHHLPPRCAPSESSDAAGCSSEIMTTTGTQAAYYGLNIAGGVGLVVLLATTLLSRRVKKQPMLINMYITCIYEAFAAPILFVAIAYVPAKVSDLSDLRFYANQYTQRGDGLMVPRIKAGSPLCFAQAIIFTPTPPLCVAKLQNQPISTQLPVELPQLLLR